MGVRFVSFQALEEQPNQHTAAAKKQLEQYFSAKRHRFELTFDLEPGPAFRRRAQSMLDRIPYGERWTYSQLAGALGKPSAARAVGSACASNPVPVLLPCHRVVPASGGIGNYAGGVAWKQALLDLEAGNLIEHWRL
ncbi:Methylated-DNA--protein-cysteine methyltransferase [Corynebacterium gerontici]|uniref:methylated-DNA--[protein]-cysteine S-methyltransferase n=2 Tax=Corynebacterium gerontici TaxID=2079234 RepID=A0A3G6IX91_9CORY|nr:Methylated-DNA--protein-cysteine methyltransferase [Corynebacterium gerontici]